MRRLNARVRSLERRYAREIAQVKCERFVDCLLTNWDCFMEANMDAMDILRKMRIAPNSLDTWPKAIRYIDRCIREDREPEFQILFTTLAPWTLK